MVNDTIGYVTLNTTNGVVNGMPFEMNWQQTYKGLGFLHWKDERYAHMQ